MKFSILTPLLAFAIPTSAIITGLTVPSTVAAGETFTLTLNTANYIQTVYDVSVAFGIAPGDGHSGSLGTVFASAYLGPPLSNILTPIRFTGSIDGRTPKGDAIIAATVTSLYGVGGQPAINTYNATVTVV